MAQNPWNVDSIEAFTFLKCPECNFDTKEEDNFQDHAIENHPMSFVFFQKQLKEEPFDIKEEYPENKPENNLDYIENHEYKYTVEAFSLMQNEENILPKVYRSTRYVFIYCLWLQIEFYVNLKPWIIDPTISNANLETLAKLDTF